MRKYIIILIMLVSVPAFAQARPFIPKDNQALPDNYEINIYYVTGDTEKHEIASHRLSEGLLEFATKGDVWNWVPISSVKRIEFDKRFSKIIAIKEAESVEK